METKNAVSFTQLISSAQNLLAQRLAFAGNRAPSWATGDRDFLGKVARMFVAMLNSESGDATTARRRLAAVRPIKRRIFAAKCNDVWSAGTARRIQVSGLKASGGRFGIVQRRIRDADSPAADVH